MAIDRLIGILTILLREEQVTAGSLAERFEVSQRTIVRDVDRLCQAGIPLRTARGAGGGISIMEGYAVDRTMLTNADRAAILAGLRSLDSVSGTGYYRQLMEKLPKAAARRPDRSLDGQRPSSDGPQDGESAGDDCVTIDLANWYGPMLAPRLAELKDACARRRAVAFTYCAPTGETHRVVEPCRLVFRWSSWYLWSWCRERRDFRLFKLNRMKDLTVTEETFPPRAAPPMPPAERSFPQIVEAVIRFAPEAKWRLVDEYGWESFCQEPDGSLLFRRGFPGREELLRWVLTFADQAELLGPPELRREMAELVEKLKSKYDRQLSHYMD